MKKMKIIFYKCIQDSQEYGSDDEHMVSRVFFDIEIDGERYEKLFANIKQTVGSDIETAPFEIERPTSYQGPLSYEPYRNAVEDYFRGLVGSQGSGIRIHGGSNIRMQNNTFIVQKIVEIDVESSDAGW